MVTKRLIKGIVRELLMEMVEGGEMNAKGELSRYFESEFSGIGEKAGEPSARDAARATVAASIELLMGDGELRLGNEIFNVVKGILSDNGLLDGSRESRTALINIMDGYMMDENWKDREMHGVKKLELLNGEV